MGCEHILFPFLQVPFGLAHTILIGETIVREKGLGEMAASLSKTTNGINRTSSA